MGDLNEFRTHRVADVLSDFCNLQRCIASANTTAPSQADYFSPAWTLLRQCATDGQFILDCSADVSRPVGRTEHEQQKLELQHVLLDAYARRHEAQKIYLRQMAAQRCISDRKHILDSSGGRPNPSNQLLLHSCDVQLQQELQQITDEFIYLDMLSGDQNLGRWTAEDPGLYDILNWLSTRS
ncbi:hypothetical protein ISF_06955 [Cordyceps fumosorosea ARSEF 2679]|uniref:Uncharacterized protein n=1 Tax=Cordyceps fumosorosea (strain ARSEF 2679) TaxID=1081104 RepID=A0A167QK47_CORFA|nr:hypothetical protein ISF_06955 [Cordyceps fumosorosea ARSEF 2679]OAA57714.1 hypothetical protein ISF_06955 [Cordyceps fumosorosea ARSEF 2679]